jgi:hypothetical protein
MQRFRVIGSLALISALSATAVLAKEANFDNLIMSAEGRNARRVATGYTGGSFSLTSIANRDRSGNPCIGYGSPNPDHILVLQKDYPRLKIQVDSGGQDTTLLIRGQSNIIRCGDDTGSRKDASIEDTGWKAGRYRIWVGSIDAGKRRNYTISVQE